VSDIRSLRHVKANLIEAGYLPSAVVVEEAITEIESLRQKLAEARAALAVIALEEQDEYPSTIAFQALGSPPTRELWEMVKAARVAGGGE
jgi:hypothetical protein